MDSSLKTDSTETFHEYLQFSLPLSELFTVHIKNENGSETLF